MSIDVGSAAANYNQTQLAYNTWLNKTNPANASGVINVFELWFFSIGRSVSVGTFYGSGVSWSCRDQEALGDVAAGSKQTFSGLNCDVQINDLIGIYSSRTEGSQEGNLESDLTGGTGVYRYSGLQPFETPGAYTYDSYADHLLALYGIGCTVSVVTTQAATDVSATGCTGNGEITDTGGADCTRRGFCYMAGTSGDPTTANSVAYDDGSFGAGVYTKAISDLSVGTGYRVRAYSVNPAGISYGSTVQVTTFSSGFIPQVIIF